MKNYVKFFFFTSVPFGLFVIMFSDFFTRSNEGIIVKGLLAGLMFGCGMTLVLGSMDLFFRKKIGSNVNDGVKHQIHFSITLPYDKVFELSKQSITQIRKAKITREDYTKGTIHVKTGITLKSWGEKIFIHLEKINENQTKVRIQSVPIMSTTLKDYGKNFENFREVKNYIKYQAS